MNMKFFLKVLILFYSSVAPALTDESGYSFKSIDGGTLDISAYQGKAVLVANTASRCGFTSQYSNLEKLHRNYR